MRVLNPFLFVSFLLLLSQDVEAVDAVSEATAFREAGHYREALVVLERARERGEGDSSPWLREQSLALRGLGRREEALAANADALERAAALGPAWEARVLNDRGLLLAEFGRVPEHGELVVIGSRFEFRVTVSTSRRIITLELNDLDPV